MGEGAHASSSFPRTRVIAAPTRMRRTALSHTGQTTCLLRKYTGPVSSSPPPSSDSVAVSSNSYKAGLPMLRAAMAAKARCVSVLVWMYGFDLMWCVSAGVETPLFLIYSPPTHTHTRNQHTCNPAVAFGPSSRAKHAGNKEEDMAWG